jgi:hypothetical protein
MRVDYPTISRAAVEIQHRCLRYPARLQGVVRDMACDAVIRVPHMTRVSSTRQQAYSS